VSASDDGRPVTLLPPGWPRPRGYANGMLAPAGRLLVTGGVVGWDAAERFPEGMTAQCDQAFANILAILAEAGAGPEHLVRLTWYVTDRAAYLAEASAIGAAYRARFGKHFPAMAVVEVSALMEAAALVEIEATAVVPGL
jgi:enamine deaminase RidA (YjgF/YER057c/UK114 family)